ncbi:hypothetical protein C0J45_14549, partial [Silurus meridionalis]
LKYFGYLVLACLAVNITKYFLIADCSIAITSISSPSASSLLVQWSTYSEATNYILDLRVVNMTGVAPVVVSVSASTSQKEVFGLKPGTVYTVVLKVFRFFSVACSDTKTAKTVPDTSQIITSRAISSTAFTLEWDRVSSADQYFVLVNSSITNERYNLSFTSTSAVIQNLRPTTSYDCYVFTSNSAGLGARSRVRTVTTLVPPPVVVTVVPLSTQAVHVQWQAVDKVLLYKVTVTDSKGTLLLSTTVSSTFLDVQNLIPCRLQIITVASMNMFLDAGEPKQVNYTSNTLSAVSSVSTDYSCVSASAMVSWGAVFGAESYRVTAVDQKGRTVSCTSTGTTCQLANLSCGKDYVVRVSAIANNCENASSATAFFQTVPCPPDNLNLYRECISNVIIFSWAPTNNTIFYKANMIDSTGGSQACITTDTSCFFTDTVCGRSYNFTVFGVNGDCSGPLSQAVSIRTAPCIPSNLITVSNCKSDVLMSSWDAADGVSQFIVEGRGNRGNASYVSYYSCVSNKSSCAIPGVACGESLTMMITAFNDDCYSETVLGQETNTAPCVPQTLLPINDCSSDSITLTWSTANGALFYIASVTDSLGGQYSCSTTNLNCQITGLRCGTTYNATIISSNYKCNSSVSNKITVDTAPCPPNQVQATLDCEGNRALVSWLKSQFPGSYTASMVDQSGGQLNCSTVNSSCWIPSLKCGQAYNVSITYYNNICRSKTSSPISINSIPCGPENFHTSLECSSGAVQLTWDPTYGANGYSASVVAASSGRRMFCNSTFPNCSLSSLTCGESYVAQVRSYNGTCFSMLSQTVTFKGVPCAPTNVTVARTCTNRTTVMWQASLGAQSYRVIAVSNQGKQSSCSSNTTTCSLIDLQCGQVYNVSVVAIDETCSSIQSQSATLQTGPCAPFNIHSTIQCITNIVTLSWDSSPTSMSYTGRAVGADGSIILCNSSSAQCQFMDLRCGLNYAIKLIASDGMCWSAESETFTQPTGPCAPVTVSNFLNCDTNTLSVSWTPSPLALSYSALLTPINGMVRGCTSDATNCVISGLQCGLSYSLTVLAANRACTGPQSLSQTIQAAPCIPASVSANVVCASNTVHAAWAQAVGALSYTGILTSPDGVTRSCSTSALSCEFSGLSCAKTYTVQVLANSNCNSSASTSVTVTTGPCDPSNMSAQVQCGSGAVNVSWQASAGASAYTAQAYMQNQTVPSDSCGSSNTTCSLTHLQCGTLYYVSVFASDGTCSSSPVGRTTVRTAPCPPVLQVVPSSCINDQALVLWTGSPDVLDVTLTATSVLGYSAGCTSANNSCNIQGLQCAQRYTLQGTSRGMLCNSTPSVPLNIITAPCTPAAIRANYTCGTSMAVVSWNDSLGRENFIARIQTQDQFDSCSTNLTRCTFSSLLCGRLYNVSLLAVAGQCNSSNIARTQMQTAPCAPQNVSVSLQCGNNTASVNWAPSLGAIGYDVTALGRDGDVKYCRTSNTYCQIPNLHCSQTYNFVVTPFSDVCTGWPSSTFTFTAGPCAPTGVQASLLCQNNVGIVSWIAAINAEKYIAIATSSDGFRHNCTSNGTSCQFLDFYCGKNYNITVVSIQGACWSDPSTPVLLRSAGCPPSNLVGVTQCGTNDITFTWDPSSRLGVTYFLFSQQENLANSTFNTTATFITLKHLQCGVLLAVRVAAQDNNCLSQYSAPVQIRTAPCAPSGLVATTSCGTSQATLTWLGGVGALFYTATLVSNDGGSISCTSNTTTCLVKLDCDSIYTVTVISSTGLCNSTTNSSTQLTSAPCLISNVTTQLNCTANSLAVQWISISGNKTYTALAIGNDGTRTSCNTNGTSCTIPGLRCGRSYGIAVTTLHSQCTVQTSDFQIQTAPCKSENLSVSLECNTSIATVWWNSTGLDQSYSVSAVNFTGGAVICSTKASYCTYNQFQCGEAYTVTVTGIMQRCTSQPSTSVDFSTGPCPPRIVSAQVPCGSNVMTISWQISQGSVSYLAVAQSSGGQWFNCSSSGTTCDIPGLQCGQSYEVFVSGVVGTCIGPKSQSQIVKTTPCVPTLTNVEMDCLYNSAWVMWNASSGAESYTAVATDSDGLRYQCNSSNSICTISGLQCGRNYSFGLTATNARCSSGVSNTMQVETVPCPPSNVNVSVNCESGTVTVRWLRSVGALAYTATLEPLEGNSSCCTALNGSTSCDVASLPCGQSYMVTVTAAGRTCNSSQSMAILVQTVPCAPSNIRAQMDIQASTAVLSWYFGAGSLRYKAIAVSSFAGTSVSCDTNQTNCNLINLLCGDKYNVTIQAVGNFCNNSASMGQYLQTGPCVPRLVSASYTPPVALLLWDMTRGADNYTAQAVSQHGSQASCSTRDTSCVLYSLNCSQTYNITLTAYSNIYQDGVKSNTLTLNTEPCPPTILTTRVVGDRGEVTWEPSIGAVRYTVMLEGRRGDTLYCQSTDTSCSVAGLLCGTVYVSRVTAIGTSINSSSSVGALLTTVPCLPDPNSFAVTVQCPNNSASVSWAWSDGATSYELTATSNNGDQLKCVTNLNTCNITNLECGQTYNLSLTTINSAGAASLETGITFQSRPCVPKYVGANLQCGTRTAVLNWERKPGVLYYLGSATFSPKVAAVMCNSTIDSCSFSGLQCGVQYTLSVIAYTRQCWSDFSAPVNITTEPCPVQNLTVTGSCNTNSLQLNWSNVTGVQLYTISVTGNLGYTTAFQSPVPSLQVEVPCGQSYSFSVLGKNDQCYSLTSTTAKFSTAPCAPTAVQTFIQCEDNIASVSWVNSDGALNYTAVAKGQTLGQTSICTTNTTICNWSDLLCGELYIVRVTASNLYCSSVPSDNTTIRMAPCIPKILSANFDCGLRVASLTWEASRGTQSYLMTAENDISPMVGLTTNTTNAQISELHCGQQYYFKVSTVGQGCRSKPSNSSVLQTEPCPPTAVATSVDCLSNIATVTWGISSTADHYITNVVGPDSIVTTCMSSTTSCGIATLQCGQKYNVSVTASRLLCNSKPSVTTYLNTGPCAPLNLSVSISCGNNAATLFWSPGNGSMWYYASATNAQGDNRHCNTTGTSCIIAGLQCGVVYNFTLHGSDGVCNSSYSRVVQKATGPCASQSLNVSFSCGNNTATLSWSPSNGSLWYYASAITALGDNRQCNTTGTSCAIAGLQCGTIYSLSVQGSDGVCSSPRNPVVRNVTAPCSPQSLNVSLSCENNTATVSWSSSNGSLGYYASAVNAQGDIRQCNSTGTSCSIAGLQCGIVYNFTVQATNGVCNSSRSSEVQKKSGPCAPQSLNVSFSCGNNTATLSWASSNGSLLYYASAVSAQGDSRQCNATGTSCTIAG